MKYILLSSVVIFSFFQGMSQKIVLEEGNGIGLLRLGQSFEQVANVLGFSGKLKSYQDYLAEELFMEDPDEQLECVIGFDFYVKYQHLLTLPVSYIFFKDNMINQIKVTSFPEYFFAIAKEVRTTEGVAFWAGATQVAQVYGTPDLKVEYKDFMLNAFFYFGSGITFYMRDGEFRTAHIYKVQPEALATTFKNRF